MSKKQVIVNEWEKLTALSNRRLSVQTTTTPLKFNWSIDRITIVGKLKENLYYHRGNDILILDFEQLMRFNENNGYLESVSQNGWKIVDHFGENIAYIEMLKFQKGYGRIDFNPNKINQFLASSMKNFIHDLFIEPHFQERILLAILLMYQMNLLHSIELLTLFHLNPFMDGRVS